MILKCFKQNILQKKKKSNKLFYVAGDFNLNLLYHDRSGKVQRFFNVVYRYGMIPTIINQLDLSRK